MQEAELYASWENWGGKYALIAPT
ncbi:hypothetical protein RV134_380015 [Roseovarius sp. EC-HK134]|nr:hypothetical protein RV134_380015 [Roseovarius sp. EC-HK134]